MPVIGDAMNSDMHKKFLDFLRHLFNFIGDVAQNINRTQDMNALMENDKALIELFQTFMSENPNLSDEDLHKKSPFQIRELRFRTNVPESVKKEFENTISKQFGIPYKLFSSVERPNGKFTYSYLLTPGDPETRRRLNEAIKTFVEQHKDIFEGLSVPARISLEELQKENIRGYLAQYEGLTESQVEWFENIAQDEGFHFSATQEDSGRYTISVSAVTANHLNIEGHIATIKALEGIFVKEMHDFNAAKTMHYAQLAEETMLGKKDETVCFAQNVHNVNYGLKINPDGSFEFYKNGNLDMSGNIQTEGKEEVEKKLFACIKRMEQPLIVTKENFEIFRNPRTAPEKQASILTNPLETQSFTSQQKYGRILNTIDAVAKRQGAFDFNPSEKIVSIMLNDIEANENYNVNTKASLSQIIQNINIKPEQIQEMLNSSDALNVFGIKNATQAVEFNKLFDNAVKKIALDVLKLEKQSSSLIKEKIEEIGVYNLSRNIDAFKQFSHPDFVKAVTESLKNDLPSSIFTEEETYGIVASYCDNLYEEFLNTETIQKEVHIEVEVGEIEEEIPQEQFDEGRNDFEAQDYDI